MLTKKNDLLGTLIHDVAYLLRHDIDSRLKPYNLTRVKWLALGIIDRNGPMTQTELADSLELGTASVGRLVDRLVEREFVLREQDPNDRRSYQLIISKTAHALMQELAVITDDFKSEVMESLTDTEVSTLKSGLFKLKQTLTAGACAMSAAIWGTAHKAELAAQYVTELPVII